MKATKTINAVLNNEFEADFTLEFAEDEKGNEYGILTCPFVKWLSLEEPVVWTRNYTISGDLLACIEKHYFDKNEVAIPVKGYPYDIEMEDIIHKILPQKIYEKMIKGSFKIRDA